MKKLLQKLLGNRFKQNLPATSKISGFTLIELLVAAAIAGIIVSSLLAFLVSILQTDRREQARTQTQEEIQAALDFIADDLKEAIYIYDADGVEVNSATLPAIGGIRDQLPDISSTSRPGIPILVFWKRHFYDPDYEIELDNGTSCAGSSSPKSTTCRRVKDLSRGDGNGGTVFVRSLVAYYLRSNRHSGTDAQSPTLQIDRFELRDGIAADCGKIENSDTATASIVDTDCPRDAAPRIGADTNGNGHIDKLYFVRPDVNYRAVDLGGIGTVRDRYNRWRSLGGSGGYRFSGPSPRNRPFEIVLDFVDDTFYTPTEDDGIAGNSSIFVPIRPNTTFANVNNFFRDNADCANPSIGVGRNPLNGDVNGDGKLDIATQRIPSTFNPSTTPSRADNSSSFFVCVNSVQNVARVWIRGNSLARQFRNNLALRRINPTGDAVKASSALTTASIRAAGRSSIYIQVQ